MKLPKSPLLILLIFSFLFLSHAKSAHAQVSLLVSPPRYDLQLKPGETIQQTIKITNTGSVELKLDARVLDFIVQDDSGTPVPVNEEVSGRYLASPWFTLDQTTLTLAPDETKPLYAIISAPEDALPGGHYSGVYFSPQDITTPSTSTGAAVVPQLGVLFAIEIAGDINYDALIKDFSVGNRLYEYGPIKFSAVVENHSDTHIRPLTSITIKDMLGRKVADLPLTELNIFPFTSRTLEGTWDTTWGFGRYTATLELAYGPGLSASRTLFFYLVPYRLLAAALIIILTLIVIIISIRRHLKHRSDPRDGQIDELKRRIAELENR